MPDVGVFGTSFAALLYTSAHNMPLPETKAKQIFISRSRLMNTVAMTASIGGSFQWTDSVRHSSTSDVGTLLKERHGSLLDPSFLNTMSSTTRAGPKRCPPPSRVFTGRRDILTQMHKYFSTNLGECRVFVLHGLGGAGNSQIAFKFVKECQVDAAASRYATSLRHICVLPIETVRSAYLGFRKSSSLTPLQLIPSPQPSEALL